ncbi:MAG: hypothetical protein LBC99_00240 [Spirochaetota bacterium]|nr:hypothetical protein [Spirochaetota bacterium]
MRLSRFILPAFFCVYMGTSLSAVNFEIKGEFRNRGVLVMNKDANAATSDNYIIIDSRFRAWFEPVISSNLRFVYNLQVGDISWGDLKGIARKDESQSFSGGGSQGTEGVNLKTRQMFIRYTRDTALLDAGFIPFRTPLAYVMDSNLPGIHWRTDILGITANLMYARAYSGPDGEKLYAGMSADLIDLSDDRNDYFFSLDRRFGKGFHLTAWAMYDDNGRFRETGPTFKKLQSDLFFWGAQAKGDLSPAFGYSLDGVLNTGRINSLGEGSEVVNAYAFRGLLRMTPGDWNIQMQCRILSGNDTDNMEAGTSVHQFHVLDGDEGSVDSWMGILFGGGPFNHQSYFFYGSAAGRRLNVTKGYFVRNDPGIIAVEMCIERTVFDKTSSILLSGGFARTAHGVYAADDKEKSFLGFEIDMGFKALVTEGLEVYLQLGYLFPGEALGPTVALDSIVYPRTEIGTDPVLRADAMITVRF